MADYDHSMGYEIETTVGSGFPVLAFVTSIDGPDPSVGFFSPSMEWGLCLMDGRDLPAFVERMLTPEKESEIEDALWERVKDEQESMKLDAALSARGLW